MKNGLNLLREFSIPLIAGVFAALAWANLDWHSYETFLHYPLVAGLSIHFLTNDLFMTLFFGIAAVEITQSCLPGGDLHPLKRAVNPLLATAGGVLGPVILYFLLNAALGSPSLTRGWGIPTATDIAFAWLAARFIFGKGHPAISFLLLLAIADDAIGLAIIAIFYSDPNVPVQPLWLLVTAVAMGICYVLRRRRLSSYWPFLLIGGSLSWFGLFRAHLHPALALVFIIPFLPHRYTERAHLFEAAPGDLSPLARFEHDWKVFVDLGLVMFGLVNGGVPFSAVGAATWLVLISLIVGKVSGIYLFSSLAAKLGFPFPIGMGRQELLTAGLLAGIGFTVALFVAGEAFTDPVLSGGAKMGAMLSIFAFLPGLVVSRCCKR